MHIPDGYLSPSTCGTLGAAMVPFWAMAGRRVRKVVKSRYVPYVALGASFSFIVMMFNIPVPDGTSAHAVAGTLTAILLGPWVCPHNEVNRDSPDRDLLTLLRAQEIKVVVPRDDAFVFIGKDESAVGPPAGAGG